MEGDIASIVTEEDGTTIDDDEVLSEFGGATLILLQEGEAWHPSSTQSGQQQPPASISHDEPNLSPPAEIPVSSSPSNALHLASQPKDLKFLSKPVSPSII